MHQARPATLLPSPLCGAVKVLHVKVAVGQERQRRERLNRRQGRLEGVRRRPKQGGGWPRLAMVL